MNHYRPDIDGLRAIAVISVIIYHARFTLGGTNFLAGGYIGVDVFFVISGFLITRVILRENHANTFTFTAFYERRARRILPALLLMILVSIPFAWILLLPNALKEYSASASSALLSLSNIWFWLEDSYTAEASQFKPLLHTWSLGIEEQFYLIFPVLLVTCNTLRAGLLFPVMFILFCASLYSAEIGSHRFPNATFYLLYSRGWELIAGAFLALPSKNSYNKHRSFISFMPLIGLTLILLSVLFFDEKTAHPSMLTLIPVIGTMLCIRFGGELSKAKALLASKFLVQIGLWSYSLYLWHFPVFAFAKVQNSALDSVGKINLIILTLALSVISFYAFERPMRNKLVVKRALFWKLICVMLFVIFLISGFIYVNNGVYTRFGSAATLFQDANIKHISQNGSKCANRPAENACVFIADPSAHTVILYGDSHANSLAHSLLTWTQKNKLNLHIFTRAGCLQVPGTVRWINQNKFNDCDRRNYLFQKLIAARPPSTIIYSARFPLYFNGTRFDNGEGGMESGEPVIVKPDGLKAANGQTVTTLLQKMVREWLQYGHRVVLVYPIPEVGWHIPQYIKMKIDLATSQINRDKNSNQIDKKRFLAFKKGLFKILCQHKSTGSI